MNHSQTVTVFNFRTLDRGTELAPIATYKASREKIALMRNAVVLEGTGESIPVSKLDEQGHYQRRATGWGEL